ncbi:hypothetical protein NEMBOFW57_000442 [Staphylotrichum longicolle]|uniref:Uncharacterized protein n=1 Tax=Staphylotrichum longicolle TaxID=669026 RepID=A0AAD4EZW7_9PEZI|nr:hypothetical protein NEMBOFW57_000442 [Staphylotrichum longicolle]
MASFSRGFAPRFLLLVRQQAPGECAAAQARLLLRARFSTSRLLQKAARSPRPVPKTTPKPPVATAPKAVPVKAVPVKASPILKSATTQAARPATYAEQLALKGRTILYESPSHFWCRLLLLGRLLRLLHRLPVLDRHPAPARGPDVVDPARLRCHPGVHGRHGCLFVMGAGRIVRSIEAVPAAAVAKQIAAKAAGNAAAPASPSTSRWPPAGCSPSRRPRSSSSRPRRCSCRSACTACSRGGRRGEPEGDEHGREGARGAGGAGRQDCRAQVHHGPHHDGAFRDAKAFGTAFGGIKRSFSREGFAKIQLGKQEYSWM